MDNVEYFKIGKVFHWQQSDLAKNAWHADRYYIVIGHNQGHKIYVSTTTTNPNRATSNSLSYNIGQYGFPKACYWHIDSDIPTPFPECKFESERKDDKITFFGELDLDGLRDIYKAIIDSNAIGKHIEKIVLPQLQTMILELEKQDVG